MVFSIKSCLGMVAAGLVLSGGLMGCDNKEEKPVAQSAAAAALPTGLFLTAAPTGKATEVGQVISGAADGEKVVVTGVVGGRKEPFVPNRAAVLIIDKSIPDCVAEGDACKTPWDYCCTPKEKLKGHVALVQVVDATGQPLKAGLEKAGGMAPLKTVLVEGTVQREKESGNITINATGIYVQP